MKKFSLVVLLMTAAACSDTPTQLEPPVALSEFCSEMEIPEPGCIEGGGGTGDTQDSAWPVRVSLYSNWGRTQARFTIVHTESGWDGGYVEMGSEGIQIAYTGASGRFAYAHNSNIVAELCALAGQDRILEFTAFTHVGLSTRQVSGTSFLGGCEGSWDSNPWK